MSGIDAGPPENWERRPGIAWLPLFVGLSLLVVMTLMPSLAVRASGEPDHIAALLIFWAMSAGIVRGVGYLPAHFVPRSLFSGYACLTALALAVVRIGGGAGLHFPNGLF